MAKVPIFIWLTLILAVELLLQLSPLTGIALMMFGAPGWSVLLINGILISLIVDVWRGRLPRWVGGVPMALYGLYLGVYLTAYAQYVLLDRQVRAANFDQSIAFDPDTQDLVADHSSASDRTGLFAPMMVGNFKLKSMYEINRKGREQSRVTRLFAKPQCDEFRKNDFRRVTTNGLHVNWVFIRNVCGATFDEPTSRPLVTLSPKPNETRVVPWRVELQPIEITDPDGQSIRLTTGTMQLPTLIPMPVIGCTLISSTPRWQCFAHFARTLKPIGGEDHWPTTDGRAWAAAAALGLEPRMLRNVRRTTLSSFGEIDPSEIP